MRRVLPAALGLTLMSVALSGAGPPTGGMPTNMPPMDRYQFGLLRKGKAWTPTRSAAGDSIQAGHLANIARMYERGLVVGAGPLKDPTGELRGVLVFHSDSVALIRAEAQRDPAIGSGRLELDLYPWFAPARIGDPYRKRTARGVPDSMVTVQLVLMTPGPKHTREASPDAMKVQANHVANVFHLLETGEAVAAGPFLAEAGRFVGVFVFGGDSAAARRAIDADPAVAAGRLGYRQLPWYVAYGTFPGDTL